MRVAERRGVAATMVVPDRRLRRLAYGLHFDHGLNAVEIQKTKLTCYSVRTVQLLLDEFRTNFQWQRPAEARGRVRVLNAEELDALRDIVEDNPALYLDEIKKELREEYKISASRSSICRAIHEPVSRGGLGLSLLVLETRALQQDHVERCRFQERLKRGDFEHKNVIVIDECSVGRNHARRRRGYGTRGKRVVLTDVFGNQPNGTLMAACDCNGFVKAACEWIVGTVDGDRFVQWVENSLCPVLGNYVAGEPRSVVVLDNVEMHHRPEVVDAIEGAGALAIYLPRYSPDYSPIELGFAHTKQELRKQSIRAPASDIEFQDRLFACLESWSGSSARHCFRHCNFDVELIPDDEQAQSLLLSALVLLCDQLVDSD